MDKTTYRYFNRYLNCDIVKTIKSFIGPNPKPKNPNQNTDPNDFEYSFIFKNRRKKIKDYFKC